MTQAFLAATLAGSYHLGQTRTDGVTPFISHPDRAAQIVRNWITSGTVILSPKDTEALVPAAMLHDVLEDTSATPQELLDAGVDSYVVHLVEILTKEPGTKNVDYYEKLQSSQAALVVKAADRCANLEDCVENIRRNLNPKRWYMYAIKTEEQLVPYYEGILHAELMLRCAKVRHAYAQYREEQARTQEAA